MNILLRNGPLIAGAKGIAAVILAFGFSAAAVAGPTPQASKLVMEPARAEVPVPWWITYAETYTGRASFDGDGGPGGNAETVHDIFEAGVRFRLNEVDGTGWSFAFGVGYERWDFEKSGQAPLPDVLQNGYALLSLEYRKNHQLGGFVRLRPEVAFEHDIRWDSFAVSGSAGFAIPLHEKFILVLGVNFASFRSLPVLPGLGFVWRISDRWTLSMIPPEPRLTYRASDQWQFWLQAEIAGGGFRRDDRDGRDSEYRNALVIYSEARVGTGFSYSTGSFTLEVSAGYVFDRRFDYQRVEREFTANHGAPYIRAAFITRF